MLVLQREISEEPLSIWAVSHIGACSNPIVKSCRSVEVYCDVYPMQGHEQKSPSYLPTERTYTLEEQVSGYKSSKTDLSFSLRSNISWL